MPQSGRGDGEKLSFGRSQRIRLLEDESGRRVDPADETMEITVQSG